MRISEFKGNKLYQSIKSEIINANIRVDELNQKIDLNMDDKSKKELVKVYRNNLSKEQYLLNCLYIILRDAGLR